MDRQDRFVINPDDPVEDWIYMSFDDPEEVPGPELHDSPCGQLRCHRPELLDRRSPNDVWVPVSTGEVLTRPNRADGDCLFVSVSQQLYGSHSSQQLRDLAVNYIEAHPDQFNYQLMDMAETMIMNREIPESARVNPEALPQLARQMLRLPWTWAGSECIAALSCVFNREVRVYQENGDTIPFIPHDGVGQSAPIRIIYRYGQVASQQRSHYESVLAWRPLASPTVLNREVATQTCENLATENSGGEIKRPSSGNHVPIGDQHRPVANEVVQSVATQTSENENFAIPSGPTGLNVSSGNHIPISDRERETNELEAANVTARRLSKPGKSRASPIPPRNLRPRPISAIPQAYRKEDFSDSEVVQEDDPELRWKECIICRHYVGHYVCIGCGAFPVCGSCIRRWYIVERQVQCIHCNSNIHGWTKVFNQN